MNGEDIRFSQTSINKVVLLFFAVIQMSKLSAQENKIGNFDWITEFNEIEEYLQNKFTGLEKIDKCNVRVLVIGCGTSKLSVQLAHSGFGEVVSVDNDCECIHTWKKCIMMTKD